VPTRKIVLPIIVISQFCCTSLWFAGNGIIDDLVRTFQLEATALGHLTIAVQLGFILGTLLFAVLSIADRFSPSKVFFISAILAAFFNFCILWDYNSITSLLLFRFLTGFFLAGIYPVGMKIAADYYDKGLGKSLGFLVGALVLGTAFPHLLKGMTTGNQWKYVVMITSVLALTGGLLMILLVKDGPYRRIGSKLKLTAFVEVFNNPSFKGAAFGYLGHMWELYTFWAFVPIILNRYLFLHPSVDFNVANVSFAVIGIGSLACITGGYLSQRIGTRRTSFIFLLLSGICCIIAPLLFTVNSEYVFIGFLLFWGITVIADSPLLSALVANNAPSAIKGTSLTVVTCLGFAITIISIQLLNFLIGITNNVMIYSVLAVGPIIGLIALKKKRFNEP
jgi:MFS family permease